MTFDELDLSDDILDALDAMHFRDVTLWVLPRPEPAKRPPTSCP